MSTAKLRPTKCPYCKALHRGIQVETKEDERNHLLGPVTYACRSCGHEIDVLRMAFVLVAEQKKAP